MDSAGETACLSAQEWVLRDTLLEIDAALKLSRPCTYASAAPGLVALGVAGTLQPVYSCRTCANERGAPVGICEPCALLDLPPSSGSMWNPAPPMPSAATRLPWRA